MATDFKLNPNVTALPPYNAGMNIAVARSRTGRDDIAALASNENPYGCSPRVLDVLKGVNPSRYADPNCMALRAALSRKLAVPASRIVVGNGSEEMIAAICRAALRPFSTVLTVKPGFGLHEIEARANGAKVVKHPMTRELGFDIDGLLVTLRKKPTIFFLSSPSNPVGPALDRDQLRCLIGAVPKETLFVLDEAYFEFCGADAVDGVQTLEGSGIAYAVLRTFSKAYGLAGLRVGYAVASDERIASAIAAAKTPFNVNVAAQLAAVAALDDQAWMREAIAKVADERNRMAREAVTLGYFAPGSMTNFLYLDVKGDSGAAFDHFLSRGIIVKPWMEPEYATFIRVTVGLPPENDRFLSALSELSDTFAVMEQCE
ncbi:UNVERIFIED_ORG: histidinol-phosphate aminotransferase [Rhizobium aethiopicum]